MSTLNSSREPAHHRPAEAAEAAVLEWLEGQASITRLWIEILISRNGQLEMVENLARHARFLENIVR